MLDGLCWSTRYCHRRYLGNRARGAESPPTPAGYHGKSRCARYLWRYNAAWNGSGGGRGTGTGNSFLVVNAMQDISRPSTTFRAGKWAGREYGRKFSGGNRAVPALLPSFP